MHALIFQWVRVGHSSGHAGMLALSRMTFATTCGLVYQGKFLESKHSHDSLGNEAGMQRRYFFYAST